MGKATKLNENKLRNIIMSEIKRAVAKNSLNEVNIKSVDEVADGDYSRMCGILAGKIETLYMWKDYCDSLEELQKLIDRTFENIIE